MKWTLIDRRHINAERVHRFHWIEGRLCIVFGGGDYIFCQDPKREKYLSLCEQLGVAPVEEDADGKE